MAIPKPQQYGSNFMPPAPNIFKIRNDSTFTIHVSAKAVNIDVPDNIDVVCMASPELNVAAGQTATLYLITYMQPKDDMFYNNQPFEYAFDAVIAATPVLTVRREPRIPTPTPSPLP